MTSRCYACGSEEYDVFSAFTPNGDQRFEYFRCRRCSHSRLAQKVTQEQLQMLYSAEYEPAFAKYSQGQRSLLSQLREFSFDIIGRRIESHVPKGRLLEIGCGAGVFLQTMRRRGWDVYGLEPNHESVQRLRSHLGLGVIEGWLEDGDPNWGSFDVIAMLDVIEHLPDPVGALGHIRNLIRPGGVLVLSTPNVSSMEHAWFGARWYPLHPPHHLWLFSPDSLLAAVRESGFTDVKLAMSPLGYAWPSLRQVLRLKAPPAPIDAILKLLGVLLVGIAGCLLGRPATLELYARRY